MTTYSARLHTVRPRSRNRRVLSKVGTSQKSRGSMLKLVFKALGWLIGSAVLVAAAFALYFGGRTLVGSDRLRVRRVELLGNTRAGAEELAAYTGIGPDSNLLALDLDAIAAQLLHHPWIESAQVRRRLPDEVVIELTEHQPAIVVSLGGVYLANAQGHLFKRLAARDDVELPVMTGLSRDEVSRRPEQTAATIREGIALAQSFTGHVTGELRLDELHFDPYLGWSIVTGPMGKESVTTRLFLGMEPETRLDAALLAMAKVTGTGEQPAVIFADGKKSPGRVQVELAGSRDTTKRTLVATAR